MPRLLQSQPASHRLVRTAAAMSRAKAGAWMRTWAWAWMAFALGVLVPRLAPAAETAVAEATVLAVQGTAEFSPRGSEVWYRAGTNLNLFAGDTLRTSSSSRATLLLRNRTVLQVAELSVLRVGPPQETLLLQLLRGLLYFFHRDATTPLEVEAPGVNAAVLGTDFAIAAFESQPSRVTLYDGQVLVRHSLGETRMTGGEESSFPSGAPAPAPTRIPPRDLSGVQWLLHYPMVLVPEDLRWTPSPDSAFAESLRHYRAGDFAGARALLAAARAPGTPEETLYLAALQMSAGSIPEAEQHFTELLAHPALGRLAAAHLALIHRIARGQAPAIPEADPARPPSATERLARSYLLQADGRLADAHDEARQAASGAAHSGLVWSRLAELSFSLERTRDAALQLREALRLSPDHAEAWSLQGFVHSAGNRLPDALAAFERALTLDPSAANGWLGRGLCRIRQGDLASGRTDLLVAAALEPQRSVLRSYLGKAFADSALLRTPALPELASHELELARSLDPADPTPWLYSALLHQQGNRINQGIVDLQESLRRNDAREPFRSALGLDQDRAVRSANLARLFDDAGLRDISLREASRSVDADYANGDAHLFLANSYDRLRDPRRVHLRHETAWHSEHLLANLLAPVGAGSLSQTVANQEYSRLFERDRYGVVNDTTWTSNGDWLQRFSQFGQHRDLAYALDGEYSSRAGERRNHDSEELSLSATARIQAGALDDVLLQVASFRAESGDLVRRYDPETAIEGLRLTEHHEPTAHVGWHHTWNPGHHTLALVSPWNVSLDYHNPAHLFPYSFEDPSGQTSWNQGTAPLDRYHSRLIGVATELQQLWQTDSHTLIAGARFQTGTFDTTATLNLDDFASDLPATSEADPGFQRLGLYVYHRWQPVEAVALTAGVALDHLRQPVNFRSAPVSQGSDSRDFAGPKIGLATRPWRGGTLRAAWSQSLGGVSLDQSQRLEPVQIAGFTQAYRGLFPESLTGSVGGQVMQVLGVAWDQSFSPRTWSTLALERLTSDGTQTSGGFRFQSAADPEVASFTEDLDFTEDALSATVGHLLGRDLALAFRYRLSATELSRTRDADFFNLPGEERERSVLHTVTASIRYHHPSGFFTTLDVNGWHQANHEGAARFAGDVFWQEDLWIGWRFARRQAEVAAGLLNLSDTDYRLHPLSDLIEPHRERTLALAFRFAF